MSDQDCDPPAPRPNARRPERPSRTPLGAALRENLRKRKAQADARRVPPPGAGPPEGEAES